MLTVTRLRTSPVCQGGLRRIRSMLSSVPCSRRAWCRDKAPFFHLSRPCASHWLRLFQVRRFTGQPVLHLHRWNENQQGPILRGGHGCCCQHDAGVQMRRALELASSASAYNSVDRTHRLPCNFQSYCAKNLLHAELRCLIVRCCRWIDIVNTVQGLAHVSQQKLAKERDSRQGSDAYFSTTPRGGDSSF